MKNLLYLSYNKKYDIDFTVHRCNKYLLHEIEPVFKNSLKELVKSKTEDYLLNNLKIICTWQNTKLPINNVNDDVSKEINRVYEIFICFIKNIKKKVNEKGYWLDASDPHTGKCLFGKKTNFIYNELWGLKYLLKYDSEKLGCCGMVLHPKYQYNSYPITFFTDINIEELKKILDVS